jgi:hypothetical protein
MANVGQDRILKDASDAFTALSEMNPADFGTFTLTAVTGTSQSVTLTGLPATGAYVFIVPTSVTAGQFMFDKCVYLTILSADTLRVGWSGSVCPAGTESFNYVYWSFSA